MIEEIIQTKGQLLFDGAFGTYYASLYGEESDNCEFANIQDPKRVQDIHKSYLEAGCNAIKTNTFGANPTRLECSMSKIKEIIKAGYGLAMEASEGYDCVVFADIGPCLEQRQIPMFDQLKAIVDIFLEEGASYFLFETFPNAQGLIPIAQYIKEKKADSYIITSFAVTADGYTQQGLSGKRLIQQMQNSGFVDACGFNCVCGPMHLRRLLHTLDTSYTTVIMPNAGYPTILKNRAYYHDSSDYFAQEMQKIVHDGARIIGGCCGTTPVYIQKVQTYLQSEHAVPKDTITSSDVHIEAKMSHNDVYDKLQEGKKIITVEFDPPSNCDIERFMDNAHLLKEQGIDAITIADCPIARARVDASLLAAKLHREMGMTTIPHMTCRDRNINATKALLYGLGIEGIRNVLVVTGDPIPSAQRDEIKGVFSFNSQILAGYIKDLNETVFPHPFLIFGALNVNAVSFAHELEKAKRKEEQGVCVFMTQPILSQQALENLKWAKRELKGKILGGIIPIVSYRNAVYMNNEISGIHVDESYIERYKDKTREEAQELAIKLSCEIVDQMRDDVDGYYLITPFHRVEIISRIVAYIQEKEQCLEGSRL